MSDIKEEIYNKYNIDIRNENIIKLYKIDTTNVTDESIEKCIQSRHEAWKKGENGTNEKFAKKAKEHLFLADKYEAILHDKKMLGQLIEYYNNAPDSGANIDKAKKFFDLVVKTKRIQTDDVNFYFSYYPDEKIKRIDIEEMLNKNYDINCKTTNSDSLDEEVKEDEKKESSEKKKYSNVLIQNRFSKNTVLTINKCESKFNESKKKEKVCKTYNHNDSTMYEFLQLDKYQSIEKFRDYIEEKKNYSYKMRQEKGTDYLSIVDFYNSMMTLLDSNDVFNNFEEFKLLIRFTKLTPYMFEIENLKKEAFLLLFNIASEEYNFRNQNEFIVTYFLPIYDNFGLYIQGISNIFRDAKKKEKAYKVKNAVASKLGLNGGNKMPFYVNIIFALIYWPIYFAFSIFEIIRFITTKIQFLGAAASIGVLVFEYFYLPIHTKLPSLMIMADKHEWNHLIGRIYGFKNVYDGAGWVWQSIGCFLGLIMIYLLLPVVVFFVTRNINAIMNKACDWVGIHRTFKNIFSQGRKRFFDDYKFHDKKISKKMIYGSIINLACLLLFSAVLLLPNLLL